MSHKQIGPLFRKPNDVSCHDSMLMDIVQVVGHYRNTACQIMNAHIKLATYCFGILQIDAHCDLRKAYEGFNYSHASIMYNVLNEVPQVKKLVQAGIRDFCQEEWDYICNSDFRVITYFDKNIKERQYEGQTWKQIADEIIQHLPEKVYISFDADGLDPKLCPNTGTPVQGGFETEQVFYLFKQILQSGRKIIGFDLNEVGVGENDWDSNVGARVLFKLCNFLVHSNS